MTGVEVHNRLLRLFFGRETVNDCLEHCFKGSAFFSGNFTVHDLVQLCGDGEEDRSETLALIGQGDVRDTVVHAALLFLDIAKLNQFLDQHRDVGPGAVDFPCQLVHRAALFRKENVQNISVGWDDPPDTMVLQFAHDEPVRFLPDPTDKCYRIARAHAGN